MSCPLICKMTFQFSKECVPDFMVLEPFRCLKELHLWGGEFYVDGLNDLLYKIGPQLQVLYLVHVDQVSAFQNEENWYCFIVISRVFSISKNYKNFKKIDVARLMKRRWYVYQKRVSFFLHWVFTIVFLVKYSAFFLSSRLIIKSKWTTFLG